jgi:hypothetical protein
LEQRYIVTLLLNEGNKPLSIISHGRSVYGDGALKPTRADFWIREVREGLLDQELPGSFDDVLAHRIEIDSPTTARRLVHSLAISPQTVVKHLLDGVRTACFHLCSVLQTLTEAQEFNRV